MKNMSKQIKMLLGVAIVLIIVIVLLVIVFNKNEKDNNLQGEENNILQNNTTNQQGNSNVAKKLEKYIGISTDSYYMKYKTKTEDANGNSITATIELGAKDGNLAMNSEEMNIGMVKKGDTIYYVMHEQKSIVKYPLTEELQKQFADYDVVGNKEEIDESYVGSGKEEVDGAEYYYEEYASKDQEGAKTKYYFDGDELKYLKTIVDDKEEIMEIIEFSDNVKDSLFELPSDYSEVTM